MERLHVAAVALALRPDNGQLPTVHCVNPSLGVLLCSGV